MSHLLSTRDSLDDFNNPQYAQYYQYLALCQEHSCPDAYYDFTDHCTVQICPIDSSNYNYLPSLAANAVFIALFGVSLACFLGQGLLSRRFIGFTVVMVCGDILEVLGYAGRIMSHNNPWLQNGFLLQIICLTIAPAFFAAGIYLTLSRIVVTFGASNSRIKPRAFPMIFIPCDIISLVLQAIGGGMASVASNNHKSPDTGDHIMVAGLAFQVLTLGVFILLCTDFAIRTARNTRELGADEALDASHATLRASLKFKGFLVALAVATICIFIRSIYRVIELSQGWEGHLIKIEKYFIVLEGAMVVVAVVALNLFHPGWCFREGYSGEITRALKNQNGPSQGANFEQGEKRKRKWNLRGRK